MKITTAVIDREVDGAGVGHDLTSSHDGEWARGDAIVTGAKIFI
jgi:hypothetical protein